MKVAIIGAGITGAWTFWNLAKAGLKPVLIERNTASSGTSSHDSALFRLVHASDSISCMAQDGLADIHGLLQRNTDLRRQVTGSLYLADAQNSGLLRGRAERFSSFEWPVVYMTESDGRELFPSFNWQNRVGLFEPNAFRCDPKEVVLVLIREAQQMGATVMERTCVQNIAKEQRSFVLNLCKTSGGLRQEELRFVADQVVVATGLWTPELANISSARSRAVQLHHYPQFRDAKQWPSFFDAPTRAYGHPFRDGLAAGVAQEETSLAPGKVKDVFSWEDCQKSHETLGQVLKPLKKRQPTAALRAWDFEAVGAPRAPVRLQNGAFFLGGHCGTGFKLAPGMGMTLRHRFTKGDLA